jgi:hypothetical protein
MPYDANALYFTPQNEMFQKEVETNLGADFFRRQNRQQVHIRCDAILKVTHTHSTASLKYALHADM